ncbi:MAG: hypothetical protein MSD82_12480 [Prevotella sp.]|nr:hypothetical protein [Prevotella sp.]
MNTNNNLDPETTNRPRSYRSHKEDRSPDRFFKVRNILNILFMLGAVVGVLIYFYANRTVGTIVILISMVFKIIESTLRFIR